MGLQGEDCPWCGAAGSIAWAELRSAGQAGGGCRYAKNPPKYKRPGGLARRFLLRNCLASLSLSSFPLTSCCYFVFINMYEADCIKSHYQRQAFELTLEDRQRTAGHFDSSGSVDGVGL
jgi:hypothetical protein